MQKAVFSIKNVQKKLFVSKVSEIVFTITSSEADLSQSLKLTKIISFRSVYSSTISRISVLKKIFQIRFVISSVNLFDFFNTIVLSFLILSIFAQSVFFNHFSLRNFFRNSTIFQNEKKNENVYKNSFNAQNEKFESNETAIAELSIRSKFRWEFKILIKIDSTVEEESDNSRNSNKFDHTNYQLQSKNLNEIEFNLNFIRFKISKHHFSFNTSQSSSKTSINSDENEQNEIDKNNSLSKSNLF